MKVTIDIPQKEESAYREKNKVIKKAEDVFELEEVQTIKNSTKEHLQLINTFSKVAGYKINSKKSVVLL